MAVRKARAIDPDSFWSKTSEALFIVQAKGDVFAAAQLVIGAQHTKEWDFFEPYMRVNLMARRYDEALKAAQGLAGTLEIQRQLITLREDWSAQVLHYMGRTEEAGQAAAAALFRLKGLRAEMGDDYRIDLAEARIRALQGGAPDDVRALVQKSLAAAPDDVVAGFQRRIEAARIFAIANMTPEAVEMLGPLLQTPSDTSVLTVDADPAFDAIRGEPAFIALLDQYR